MEAVHKFIVADESEVSADDIVDVPMEVLASRVRVVEEDGNFVAVFTHLVAETTRMTLDAGNKTRGLRVPSESLRHDDSDFPVAARPVRDAPQA